MTVFISHFSFHGNDTCKTCLFALQVRDGVYDHLDTIAYRVMSACITMNEYPYIRYSQVSLRKEG